MNFFTTNANIKSIDALSSLCIAICKLDSLGIYVCISKDDVPGALFIDR
jgi:hypothetical protein